MNKGLRQLTKQVIHLVRDFHLTTHALMNKRLRLADELDERRHGLDDPQNECPDEQGIAHHVLQDVSTLPENRYLTTE